MAISITLLSHSLFLENKFIQFFKLGFLSTIIHSLKLQFKLYNCKIYFVPDCFK